MKDLSSNTIDCFICDLPYGTLTQEKATKGCSWDKQIDLQAFWEQVKRLAKNEHTPVLMFCTAKFGYELIKSNESWFRYDLIWDKVRGVSFLLSNKMPLRSHESIYIFSKAGPFYNRVDIKGNFTGWKANQKADYTPECYSGFWGEGYGWKCKDNDGTTRCAKTIIQVKTHPDRGKHPTEKPLELYKWLIERYCPPNGTILDPTAGSFNSCFASYELNRNSIGIELSDEYYQKACERADTLIQDIPLAPS